MSRLRTGDEAGAAGGRITAKAVLAAATAAALPAAAVVALPAEPSAARTYSLYKTGILLNGVNYGVGWNERYGNLQTCFGAEPYKAHVYNTGPGGVVRNRVEGTCDTDTFGTVEFFSSTKFFANWWCGQSTGYDQIGDCWTTVGF